MRLLICGDRNWDDRGTIKAAIQELQPKVVIEGEARGADRLAGEEAEALGVPVLRYPAMWRLFGKAAGAIRNGVMLEQGEPTHVLAFHADIRHSKGTADMLRQARLYGIPRALVSGPGQAIQWTAGEGFGLAQRKETP